MATYYLDTASLEEIERYQAIGLVDGVTTNPKLLAREGVDPWQRVQDILALEVPRLFVQVTATDADGMVRQGLRLRELGSPVAVKVPATLEGLAAARRLERTGVLVNLTQVFHVEQLIACLQVQPYMVSVIVPPESEGWIRGAVTTHLRAFVELCSGTDTRLLVAGLRWPWALGEARKAGARFLTVPPGTWRSVLAKPETEKALEQMAEAWQGLSPELRARWEG